MQKWLQYRNLILLGLIGIPLGAAVGVLDALFGRVLLEITDFRMGHPLQLIPFLCLGGMLIVFAYQKFGKNAALGMGLVFDVGNGKEKDIPLRLIPFIMGSTWITHLFGGSGGREGAAVQIGATFSFWVGKKLPIRNASHILLVAGMAAGFAGLFRTPLAAVCFALEVLVVGKLDLEALLPSLTAAFTASTVSGLLGLSKFSGELGVEAELTWPLAGKLLLLGIIFGIVGAGFAWLLKWAKGTFVKLFKNPLLRVAVIGAILSILLLLLYRGRYSGLGTNLINASFSGETVYAYDWILKLILTVVTLAAGFQGGEITPLFSIGASLGIVLGSLLGMPVELAAALGYAAVFGSASGTLLAPIMIGAEVFGFAYLPEFFIVCIIARFCNLNCSIYKQESILTGIGGKSDLH